MTQASLNTKVYWAQSHTGNWKFYLAATDRGICRVTLPNETFAILAGWVNKHIPNFRLIEDVDKLQNYTCQLIEYLQGQRQSFELAYDLYGTEFQNKVWLSLAQIPYGSTRSYSDVAKEIGSPKKVRAVGAAIGKNPLPLILPCHRVIGKNGTLTGYRGGLELKEQLLQFECALPCLPK